MALSSHVDMPGMFAGSPPSMGLRRGKCAEKVSMPGASEGVSDWIEGKRGESCSKKTFRIRNYLLAVQQVHGAAREDGARRARVNTRRLRAYTRRFQGRQRRGGTLIPHVRRLKVSGRHRTLLLTCVWMRAGRQRHLHSGKHERALRSHALQRAPLQRVPSGGRLSMLR